MRMPFVLPMFVVAGCLVETNASSDDDDDDGQTFAPNPGADDGSDRPNAASADFDADSTIREEFRQTTAPAVDILFVVDNTCSMSQVQSDLSDNGAALLNPLLDAGLDFHIGFTTTDMDTNPGVNGGSRGELFEVNGARWIDANTTSPQSVFVTMATPGTTGSSLERGTSATFAALEQESSDANLGFFRDEASIHTVVVSNERNSIRNGEIGLAEFISWYDGLKPASGQRTFSSFTTLDQADDYQRVTDQIGGLSQDLDTINWPAALSTLGNLARGLETTVHLRRLPQRDTLEVEVEEPLEGGGTQILRLLEDTDWGYNPVENAIAFFVYVPPPDATVVVTYEPLRTR